MRKRDVSKVDGKVIFATGDAMALPFADATFDCIVNGFMLRNVADLRATFVPLLGVVVGRQYAAYRYLFQSLTIHPDADALARIMRAAGFAEADYRLTGFGTVAIHLGRKAAIEQQIQGAG